MKYRCSCGYIYDDHVGDASHGIQPMPFTNVPKDWACPLCGQKKDAFEPDSTMSGRC